MHLVIYLLRDKKAQALERYRSGHNEAVLKTVCRQRHVGSNPTLSASYYKDNMWSIRRSTQAGRRGSPGKGVGR